MKKIVLQRKSAYKTCGSCGENMNDCECWQGGVDDK